MSTEILSRSYAGLLVEVHYGNGKLALSVREGDEGSFQTVPIDPENVLDAFAHPYCYLPRETSNESAELEEGTELDAMAYWRELRSTSQDGG